MPWRQSELEKIATSDDLHVSPFRADGITYGTPTWIWSVVVGGDLYVRPYNGVDSRWYRAAATQAAGRITAAGLTRDVTFEPADVAVESDVDKAYSVKYRGSPYLAHMIGARAKAATLKIEPSSNEEK